MSECLGSELGGVLRPGSTGFNFNEPAFNFNEPAFNRYLQNVQHPLGVTK
jgi:hypothetical protein